MLKIQLISAFTWFAFVGAIRFIASGLNLTVFKISTKLCLG